MVVFAIELFNLSVLIKLSWNITLLYIFLEGETFIYLFSIIVSVFVIVHVCTCINHAFGQERLVNTYLNVSSRKFVVKMRILRMKMVVCEILSLTIRNWKHSLKLIHVPHHKSFLMNFKTVSNSKNLNEIRWKVKYQKPTLFFYAI